jgi:hypothetical protein
VEEGDRAGDVRLRPDVEGGEQVPADLAESGQRDAVDVDGQRQHDALRVGRDRDRALVRARLRPVRHRHLDRDRLVLLLGRMRAPVPGQERIRDERGAEADEMDEPDADA